MGKENKNLSSLKGANKIRQRVGVMLGSDDIKGVQQTVFEIVSNSIDRFKAGFGDTIKVTKHSDKSYTIQDYADGLPMEWNDEEECYNWELALRTLYAGTNYNVSNEDHDGQLGYNGAGLYSSIASSEFATVISKKHNKIFTIKLKQGRPIHKETNEFVCEDNDLKFTKELGLQVLKIEPNSDNETGTYIHYKPDLDIFTDIDIPIEWFKETFKRQVTVNKGLKIIFYDENTNFHNEYFYENGVIDYLQEKTSNNNLSDILYFSKEGYGRDDKDKPEYKVSFEIAFRFSNEVNFLEYYHNSSYLEYGGSPDKAVKNAFVYVFDKYLKDKGMYTKNEKKITFVDIQDSLALIVNSYSSRTSYENQTKKAITNKFIQELIQDSIKDFFVTYFAENPMIAENLTKQIIINKRSREKAEISRINIKKKLMDKVDGISNKIQGLVDCREYGEDSELFIAEGLSALGSLVASRNAKNQACFPIRGKLLSTLKVDYDKIFANDLIMKIINCLGCGIEVKMKNNKNQVDFDINKLRYGKIMIATDADSDGESITCLLLTMFYRLTPTLIKEGRIYKVRTPLYEITYEDKTIVYAFSETEYDELMKGHNPKQCKIQRSKGLGEQDAEEMHKFAMNPDTRYIYKITVEDAEQMAEQFEKWMATEVEGRREYIEEHLHEYTEYID